MSNDNITEPSQVSEDLRCTYIDACHILHNHGLVDAYGHVSVRLSQSTFLMSRYMAPPLVASTKDLVVYKVEDGEAVAADAPRGTQGTAKVRCSTDHITQGFRSGISILRFTKHTRIRNPFYTRIRSTLCLFRYLPSHSEHVFIEQGFLVRVYPTGI